MKEVSLFPRLVSGFFGEGLFSLVVGEQREFLEDGTGPTRFGSHNG